MQSLVNETVMPSTSHLYYPPGANIPGYEVNSWSVPALLAVFFGACTALFSTTYYIVKSVQPKLSRTELATVMWFVLSGAVHLIFEGYYAQNFRTLASKQTIMGQMWKEYAFSDSRYLTSNSFVLCVESLTILLWGPGCLLVASLIVQRHPLRYPLQALVSFGQMYGDILYYATAAFDNFELGVVHSRPEPLYFWFYFVFMNAIWIVLPAILVVQSCVITSRAIATVQRVEISKKKR